MSYPRLINVKFNIIVNANYFVRYMVFNPNHVINAYRITGGSVRGFFFENTRRNLAAATRLVRVFKIFVAHN